MRFLLVNPDWNFEGSVYFGCREPHLPLEFGYARQLLEQAGHEVQIVDAQMTHLSVDGAGDLAWTYRPDVLVLTTAPSYLFWRCPPPELKTPILWANALRTAARTFVVVGPHASTSPETTLRKLNADVAILGECEEILPLLAEWRHDTPSTCQRVDGVIRRTGGLRSADMSALPALRWTQDEIARHTHHHHRFDAPPAGPGAEMETSRGCPYRCTFCAKNNFRDSFRRRPESVVLEELDRLIAQGVDYVYFIDEIFLPFPTLLEAIAARPIRFGIQTRIDLWSHSMLELLGRAGCVSIEAGVESLTIEGRASLNKHCKLSTEELAERLIYAKRFVPFVQANLLDSEDDPATVETWRHGLIESGVWANRPVPLFPYPGSPAYTNRWGEPDETAWERADDYYRARFHDFSDVQDPAPQRLVQLEQLP